LSIAGSTQHRFNQHYPPYVAETFAFQHAFSRYLARIVLLQHCRRILPTYALAQDVRGRVLPHSATNHDSLTSLYLGFGLLRPHYLIARSSGTTLMVRGAAGTYHYLLPLPHLAYQCLPHARIPSHCLSPYHYLVLRSVCVRLPFQDESRQQSGCISRRYSNRAVSTWRGTLPPSH